MRLLVDDSMETGDGGLKQRGGVRCILILLFCFEIGIYSLDLLKTGASAAVERAESRCQ